MRFKITEQSFLICIFFLATTFAKAQCSTTISSFPYNEGFETAPAWTSGGTNSDWAWGTPSHPTISSAGGGSKCWSVGGLTGSFYNYSELSWIMSPCFDFSSLNYPWISFKIFWEDEYKYDGMVLQYSINSGTTWINVGAYGDPVNCLNDNWYTYNNVTWLTSASPKHGWTGRTGATSGSCQGGNGSLGWVTAKHCMSSLAGQPNVRFRFLFGSGTTCNSYDGISVDDIHISDAPPNVANFSHSCINYNTQAFTNLSGLCPNSFSWNFDDPVSGSNNTSAIANPTHTFSNPGTYNVSLTVSGPCNASNTITIPIYIIGGGTVIQSPTCFGANNGYLTQGMMGSPFPYHYIWSTGDTTQTISGLGPGTYSVTVTSGVSCPFTTSITLTSPQVLAATTSTVPVSCFGGNNGSAMATCSGGTGGYTYSWAPTGGTSATASGLAAGTYTVTVTDGYLCSTTATAIVSQPSSALLVSNLQTAVSCFGGNNGTASAIATGGTTPYSYSWSPSGGLAALSTGLSSGNYTVTVTDANGCSSSATSLITQPTAPLIASFSTTASLCALNNGTATATVSGGTIPYAYLWSPSGGSNASASGLAPGAYTLTITDANGCIITPITTISNAGFINATLSSTPILCYGGSDGTATASIAGGSLPYSYIWNSGQTTSVAAGLNAGNYCVSVSDINGCTTSACINIPNPPQMGVDFSSTPTITDMSDPEVHFTDLTASGINWQWSFGDTSYSFSQNPIHVFGQEGTYPVTLVVTNSSGCVDSITHYIIINDGFTFYAPNAFTPNNSGLNDTFSPKGSNWDPKTYTLSIFDRWGNLVFETKDVSLGWNGCVRNSTKIAESDVYVWKAVVSDTIGNQHYYKGTVSIIR